MADVVLERVFKRYDKTEVIRDVSLSIRDREFVVLVGPSGCGKSTVLRMIAGLETISEGCIRIGEQVVNDVPPKDRDIAMVFQNYALYPHMSVYDNMAFGLKMRKTPKPEIEAKVREAARVLDLESLLHRKPKQLSGGQRQRVALGRAIVRKPQVFLMDEPLSNLDAKLRVQMRSEIAALHQRLGATTIYVTHDQVEAMTMGDRIVILNAGVIQQVDSPLVIYHDPVNMFVAGFVGQMNFWSGTLSDAGQVRLSASVETAGSLGVVVPLPAALQDRLGHHPVGLPVVMGIRPEHVVPPDEPVQGHVLTVRPQRLELLGSEQMVYFTLDGGEAGMARWPSDLPVVVGEPLTVKLALDKALLFDGASQERIRG